MSFFRAFGAAAAAAMVAAASAGETGTASNRTAALQSLLGRPAAASGQTNTVITSKRLHFDYGRSIATFEGDVVVVDPQVRIESQRMIVTFDATNSVKAVTAMEDVHLFTGDREGTCQRAVYLVASGEILLTGSPALQRERDRLSGDRITFWVDREEVLCEPGQLVITPASRKGGP
jgi:lipopolysaccharide transport protein LptA